MRTEPRRKERAMNSAREMELLLERMAVGRLAVMTAEGPYIVALNHLFLEGSIYFSHFWEICLLGVFKNPL